MIALIDIDEKLNKLQLKLVSCCDEVLNTDAEGRLVLADALTFTEKKFKPKFILPNGQQDSLLTRAFVMDSALVNRTTEKRISRIHSSSSRIFISAGFVF